MYHLCLHLQLLLLQPVQEGACADTDVEPRMAVEAGVEAFRVVCGITEYRKKETVQLRILCDHCTYSFFFFFWGGGVAGVVQCSATLQMIARCLSRA